MEKLLTVLEVADLLGESVESVYRYARQGTIPSIRLNRKIKFSPKQLEEFINNGGCSKDN